MAWVCLLTSWWTPATDTTAPSCWSIEQHDPNFTLPDLPFGRLQWDSSPFTLIQLLSTAEPFSAASLLPHSPVYHFMVWQKKYSGQKPCLYFLCTDTMFVTLSYTRARLKGSVLRGIINRIKVLSATLWWRLIMCKTLVCLDGQESTSEATKFDSQIMGALGWLALTGITPFSEIAAKTAVIGSGEQHQLCVLWVEVGHWSWQENGSQCFPILLHSQGSLPGIMRKRGLFGSIPIVSSDRGVM